MNRQPAWLQDDPFGLDLVLDEGADRPVEAAGKLGSIFRQIKNSADAPDVLCRKPERFNLVSVCGEKSALGWSVWVDLGKKSQVTAGKWALKDIKRV